MKTKRTCSRCDSDKYYCKGMCKSCYTKQLVPSRWSKEFDSCISCGTSKIPHKGRGMCGKCYDTQPTNVLCACGCGLTVPQRGNQVRTYRKGHWMRNNPEFMVAHITAMTGENNPQYGKFGKEHPAYGHKTKPEVREARRKRRLKAIAEKKSEPTDIEIILSNLLDELSIVHHPQIVMYDKFTVDEFLPDYNIVIEAFGGYWHGDTRKFTLDKTQYKRSISDLGRCKYLNACGHRVIILWENELKNNINFCKQEILTAIENFAIPLTQNILQ